MFHPFSTLFPIFSFSMQLVLSAADWLHTNACPVQMSEAS